jgi:hypothetical protein
VATAPIDRKQLVRERLLISRDQVFQETLAKASKLFQLDETGVLHPRIDLAKKSNRTKIELFILARYLAHEGGIAKERFSSVTEIATFFGIDPKEVGTRASELKVEGKIKSESRGCYSLAEGRVSEVLADLEQ